MDEIAANLGLAYARAGRFADALPVLDFARQQAAARGLRFTYARQHAQAGEAYLLVGRPDEAARLAGTALEAARAQKQTGQEAAALRLSAEIAAAAHDDDRAEGEYRQAMAIASDIDARPLVAHCHAGLGMLFQRAGRRELAEQHLEAATAAYREMDMRYWLERLPAR